MFYEHRLYFETADLDSVALGILDIPQDIALLGREALQVEGVPLFQFQTEQPLDEQTRERLTSLMQPSLAALNNEFNTSYRLYQQWLSTLDAQGLAQWFSLTKSADAAQAEAEQESRTAEPKEGTPDYWVKARVEVTFLNRLKNQICDVTKALDTTQEVFDPSLEATAVKHAVTILLSELATHGLLPETESITLQDYQEKALRTLRPDLSVNDRLTLCGLGLPGEVGEVADLLKKHLFHRNGKPLNVEKLTDELGDVLWYAAVLCSTLGISIEDVMTANLAKVQARHPNGFNPRYGSDSHASEEGVQPC
jgi:NTP pyrophosphatase (non-canonical NTP hydrolase)